MPKKSFSFSHEMPCQRENKYIYVKHGNEDCVRDNVLIVIKFYGNFSWQFLFLVLYNNFYSIPSLLWWCPYRKNWVNIGAHDEGLEDMVIKYWHRWTLLLYPYYTDDYYLIIILIFYIKMNAHFVLMASLILDLISFFLSFLENGNFYDLKLHKWIYSRDT